MVPPIIVCGRGDISIYPTAEEAESAMESIDVWNGEYTVYDSEGRLLSVTIDEAYVPKTWLDLLFPRIGPCHIHEAETEPSHAAELRARLVEFLRRLTEDPGYGVDIDERWLSKATLPELIAKVQRPR